MNKQLLTLLIIFLCLFAYGFIDLLLWAGVDLNSIKLFCSYAYPVVVFSSIIALACYLVLVLNEVMNEKD